MVITKPIIVKAIILIYNLCGINNNNNKNNR